MPTTDPEPDAMFIQEPKLIARSIQEMELMAFKDQDLILTLPPLKSFLFHQSQIELALPFSSTPSKVPIWLHGFLVFAPAPCPLHPASSTHLPEEQDGQVAPECKGFQRISCYVS